MLTKNSENGRKPAYKLIARGTNHTYAALAENREGCDADAASHADGRGVRCGSDTTADSHPTSERRARPGRGQLARPNGPLGARSGVSGCQHDCQRRKHRSVRALGTGSQSGCVCDRRSGPVQKAAQVDHRGVGWRTGLGARPLVFWRTADEPGQVSGEWLLEAPWSGAGESWPPSTAVQLASSWDAHRYELIAAGWAAARG